VEHLTPILNEVHNLSGPLAEAGQHVMDSFGDKIGNNGAQFITKTIFRALRWSRSDGARDALSARHDRAITVLEGVVAELQLLGYAHLPEENDEPAAALFTADAFEAGVSSPNDGKRKLIGRMIARRYSVRTETNYEVLLRDALRIATTATEPQLSLLAALMVSSYTPVPSGISSVPESAKFVNVTFADTIAALGESKWTRSDVERMTVAGAIEEVNATDTRSANVSMFVPPRNRFALRRTDATAESQQLEDRLTEAFAARRSRIEAAWSREPIGDLWFRPAGAVLAALVLEQHINQRIRFPEWEEADDIDGALIAPMSSAILIEQSAQQDSIRRSALMKTIGEVSPKAVNDDMRRKSGSRIGGI
jgi:hypothetical protein